MRMRDPDEILKDFQPDEISLPKGNDWKTFEVKLLTPMYGGGIEAGEPDENMPVRATAIRGQLRYWWRFLAKHRKVNPLSGEELFRCERAIWGGMAENDNDYSSKVWVRVTDSEFIDRDFKRCAEYSMNKNGREYKSVPKYDDGISEYAMFSGRGKLTDGNTKIEKKPAKVLHQLKFNLKIKSKLEIEDFSCKSDILEPLRWWATFGGLGSRTRRGCGSILVTGVEPVTKDEAEELGCAVRFNGEKCYDTAIDAWKKAVKCLADFRQGGGIGRNKGYGRSKWPEADSIRILSRTHSKKNSRCNDHSPNPSTQISFPRAVFGLPIIFKFKDEDCGDPKQTELTPVDTSRLASPLFLVPYPVFKSNDRVCFRPMAMHLPLQHINEMSVDLSFTDGSKLPDFPNGDSSWREDWMQKDRLRDVEPIINNGGGNALGAFMNFFEKGGQNE